MTSDKQGITMPLLIGAALVAVLVQIVGHGLMPLRLLFAIPLVFFLPGYAITALVLPAWKLDPAPRILLSTSLSMIASVLGGFALNWLPWGLDTIPWALFLGGLTVVAAIGAMLLRPEQPPLTYRKNLWNHRLHLGLLVLALGITFGAIGIARTGAVDQERNGTTQFWLLPTPATNGSSVQLGVRNQELTRREYKVQLLIEGRVIQEWPTITLAPGEQWAIDISLPSPTASTALVEAALIDASRPDTAYRRVTLKQGP